MSNVPVTIRVNLRAVSPFFSTKYAPLFIFIAGGSAIMVLQSIHPEWLLMTAMETFITFLMYFTVESNSEAVKKLEKEKK